MLFLTIFEAVQNDKLCRKTTFWSKKKKKMESESESKLANFESKKLLIGY